ncbi:DUF2779 domain-containing protein [Kaistella carnis]|uniref:DUF2779 domain-containing protein n=1 Tax=Kaistella carnis TaxID=1241979 RepID=A0A3G8XHL7_9FLAO|nr:DUF2779 domain-containing protein [Kaistella carnis]AZI32985.1 DUF2779 domain-containing protein [Kaistella carnis]
MKNLSKSRFVSGIQCDKKLWFDFYRKDLKPQIDDQTQAVFDLGHRIGTLAQEMFPNGKDATPEDFSNFQPSIENTKKWISEKVETIYEATFSANNTFCMLDILHRKDDEVWAIEVKSSTSVKDYHFTDASLQYFVMKNAGFAPDRFFMMYINNQYVKQGELTSEIFTLTDITEQVLANQEWVEENLDRLLKMLEIEQEPVVEIGGHCSSPFGCDYAHHCWKHVPEYSVFNLYRGGKKGWNLYDQNILQIEEIPDDFTLTHFQNLQRNGLKKDESYMDQLAIKNIISRWEFPLYFFDFETIFPAIPVLDGTRPYQQVPFQYSLHILEEDGKLTHKEFLASPKDFSNGENPLKQMIEQLKKDFGNTGNIVTYNQSFEVGRLNDLAKFFSEDAHFLYQLVDRIVDLLPVFQGGHCYFPAMKNSASIKSVLPAIAPEFTYENLEIQDGGSASSLFHQSIENGNFTDENLRENLLKYCERDTLAMVIIYQFLVDLIF